jgi:apolipoprotein D and lipocalin family protein
MKPLLPALALLLVVSACEVFVPSSRQWGTPMFVVTNAQPAALEGTWYQIASFPIPGEGDCTGTVMAVTPQPDGELRVTRACTDVGLNAVRTGSATGRLVGPGRLRLSEDNSVIPTSYWLLYLSRDGRTAVIGTPLRDTGFLMRRDPSVTPEIMDTARAVFERNNYDVAALQRSPLR